MYCWPKCQKSDKKSVVFCKRMILLVLTPRLFLAESLQPQQYAATLQTIAKDLRNQITQENSRFKSNLPSIWVFRNVKRVRD